MKHGLYRIGFDVHGVIYTNPDFFRSFIGVLADAGFEVHILSGPTEAKIKRELKKYKINYHKIFSITDYCLRMGVPVRFDKKQNPFVDPYEWDRAKAWYCQEQQLALHLDDSDIYKYFFTTPYGRFFSCDTKKKQKIKVG